MINFSIVCRETKRLIEFNVPEAELMDPGALEKYAAAGFAALAAQAKAEVDRKSVLASVKRSAKAMLNRLAPGP